MVDITQVLLVVVVLILTVMLAVIGVQVVFILREFRETIKKLNKVLEDTGVISESVSRPVNMLSTMILGIKGGAGIAKLFSKMSREGKDE